MDPEGIVSGVCSFLTRGVQCLRPLGFSPNRPSTGRLWPSSFKKERKRSKTVDGYQEP